MSRRTEQALRENIDDANERLFAAQELIARLLTQNERLIAALIAPSNPVGASVVARRERPERPPVPVVEGL